MPPIVWMRKLIMAQIYTTLVTQQNYILMMPMEVKLLPNSIKAKQIIILYLQIQEKGEENLMRIYRLISKLLAILLLFTGVISIISGIMMIVTNGMGMPVSWLEGTAFTSYLIPGLILLIVIAGITISAGILLLVRKKGALETAAASGIGLLIWIFTEMYILATSMGSHFLHVIIFIEALVIIIATMILLKLSVRKV